MPEKFICTMSKEELEDLYFNQKLTIKQMCKIVGCESDITMAKILKSNGIDTNSNKRRAFSKRGNRTDAEFNSFLKDEYVTKKRSMTSIANELGISWVIVSRYLDKYGIQKRTKSEQQSREGAANWRGGKRVASNGYVEIKVNNYPRLNKRGYVYEHIYVAEQKIGRLLLPNEVVHHINRIKTDNRPENLLVLTKEEHTKLHSDEMHEWNRKKVIIS